MSAAWTLPTAAALVLMALALYRSHIAGWLGDLRIGMALAGLPRSSYTLLHDVRIPDDDGRVHIDHLICGPAGYDIVDTVRAPGRLAGRTDDETWALAQAFGEPRRIANPLTLNRRRAAALSRLVGDAPVRTLTVATRIRFPDGRPDGVLTAGELAGRILAMDAEAPPFDGRAGLRAVGLAMETEPAGRRRRYDATPWRKPLGHALLSLAACVLAFTAGPPSAAVPTPVVHYVPVPLAADRPAPAGAAPAARPHAHPKRHVSRHRSTPHHRRRKKAPMQVVAMSDGMASIMEDGHIITLHPGQKSPQGWRLVRATPRYADMIDPHGRHFHFTP